ncbi:MULTISPECIES: lyase family protein [unclassified Arthrobacter]|uniref:lyase family protein n=1 Tax=unclassified Arthrobacter TaxID=235627 RepID=UPI002DF89789|nr:MULTISPECIES: lyase family protein [unclassified Arthrobacter]MEC5190745.1 3-carboxy-cis,cis-muconate cycloisomerase [Arthrobacter sp. MP_M4]MEC5202829.1 3-carboxy-cis,cis-muconate cycloisomerase [Arthrobacter sp. MP_M7]
MISRETSAATGFNAGPQGDLGLLSPVSASPLVAALTGDRAVLTVILRVEAAWAAVLEQADLAPAGSAAVVAAAAEVDRYDIADLAVRAQGGANPVIPLLADLRGQVNALDVREIGAVKAVHTSLTSQDVLDTALMLLSRDAVRGLLTELTATTAALAALAEQHTDTLCVGRSLTQHSLPFTFGLKAAQWFHGLAAAARRLEALEFPVQTGGAAGTLAAGTVLTSHSSLSPLDLADRLAAGLGLAAVTAPWHTNRLALTALGDALAAVTDAAGKIAADVLFLSRPEVAELAEPRAAGRGGSSAMPQKQNPVLSVLVRSAALQSPGQAAQLHLAAANFNDERPDGAWHTEWPALRQLLRLGLGAAVQLRELTEGLQVFPGAMRRNLELSGPLLLSEAVTAALAPLLSGVPGKNSADGKQRLQAVVDQTLQVPAADQASTYRRLLRAAVPPELLSDARLEELLDPANYLGQAAEISRRILAAYPDYAVSSTVPDAGAQTSSPSTDPNGAPRG